MKQRSVAAAEYAALAEIRYRIRQFVRGSNAAASAIGLEPQQYELLLALQALPSKGEASIRRLSERLFLKHHSTVGLVDRLEKRGYVRRIHSALDKRKILVDLLPSGRRALESVVQQRLHELRESGPVLVEALTAILDESKRRALKTAKLRPARAARRTRVQTD